MAASASKEKVSGQKGTSTAAGGAKAGAKGKGKGTAKKVVKPKQELPWQPSLPVVTIGKPGGWTGDLLVLLAPDDEFEANADGVMECKIAVQPPLSDIFSEFCQDQGFTGSLGETASARVGGNSACRYVALVGLGPGVKAKAVAEWGTSPFQVAGVSVAQVAKQLGAKTVRVALPVPKGVDLEAAAAGMVARGVLTGCDTAKRFKCEEAKQESKEKAKQSSLETVEILCGPVDQDEATAAVTRAAAYAIGTGVARYLVETPANICTPQYLAETAGRIRDLAPERFSLTVHDRPAVEKMGMGLYLGVAAASEEGNDLRFIHLVYKPEGEVKKKVGLVGKGVTFDSGGYNMKVGPGSMIEMMKFDMGGAGAVLGAARSIAELQPAGVEVHFIIAATENMVDAKGMRPGDILTGMGGITVEINNTDAEGRLTLADALWYAQENAGVDAVIDIATLTGAIITALGNDISGHFTPSAAMAERVKTAAANVGEKTWRMPLEMDYAASLTSDIADLRNSAGGAAGSVTAALFLEKFVQTESVEWAHIDIAGTAWDSSGVGATGYGSALLTEWCVLQGQEEAAAPESPDAPISPKALQKQTGTQSSESQDGPASAEALEGQNDAQPPERPDAP